MKRFFLLLLPVGLLLLLAEQTFAQHSVTTDSLTNSIRIHALKQRKESLQREIKVQDARRNQHFQGVSVETQEVLNDRQDSLCLSLRSELVDVVLSISEMSPAILVPQLNNLCNNLTFQRDSLSNNRNKSNTLR